MNEATRIDATTAITDRYGGKWRLLPSRRIATMRGSPNIKRSCQKAWAAVR